MYKSTGRAVSWDFLRKSLLVSGCIVFPTLGNLRFFPIGVAPHYIGRKLNFFLLEDSTSLVHSNPFLAADRVENRYHCAWFTTSQDSALLFLYLSCFWQERGEEMEKDPKLCTICSFSYNRVWGLNATQSSSAA